MKDLEFYNWDLIGMYNLLNKRLIWISYMNDNLENLKDSGKQNFEANL